MSVSELRERLATAIKEIHTFSENFPIEKRRDNLDDLNTKLENCLLNDMDMDPAINEFEEFIGRIHEAPEGDDAVLAEFLSFDSLNREVIILMLEMTYLMGELLDPDEVSHMKTWHLKLTENQFK